MNCKSNRVAPRPLSTLAAALGAAVISLGILGSVATLFQSRGAPLQTLAAAERACAGKPFLSDRQACMRRVVAEAQRTTVAAY